MAGIVAVVRQHTGVQVYSGIYLERRAGGRSTVLNQITYQIT